MGDGSYAGTQVVAAGIAVGLALLAGLATKLRLTETGRGGLLMGWDRRASTSKTVAVVWTVLLVYMLLTLIFITHSHGPTALRDVLNQAPDLYFIFLGGPYAAAILAKLGVTANTKSGTLQKSDGSGAFNPLDVISNDQGATDLYDFQYTIFNLVAMLAVLFTFTAHPGRGLPQLPDFLAILTGGSAFVYTANKVTVTTPPSIVSAWPSAARVRDWITVSGANPGEPSDARSWIRVTVGSAVVPPSDITSFVDRLVFRVPPVSAGPQTITVTTNTSTANAGTTAPGQQPLSITVVPDVPQLVGFSSIEVKAGGNLSLFGSRLYPAASIGSDGAISDPTGSVSVGLQLAGDAVVTCPVDPAHPQSDQSVTVSVPAGLTPGDVTAVLIRGTSIPLSAGSPLRITAP